MFLNVTNLILASILGLTSGMTYGELVGHYKFDEVSGTVAIDSAGGADGTIAGGTTIGVPGKIGNAYSFSGGLVDGGTDDRVEVGNAPFLTKITESGQATFTAWIKTSTSPNPDGGGRDIVIFAGNKDLDRLYVDISNYGPGTMIARSRNSVSHDWYGDDPINDDEWHHVAIVVDVNDGVGKLELYVDGVFDDDGNNDSRNTNPTSFPTFNSFEIGRLGRINPIDYFIGLIDDVQVYDSALTAAEISYLFKNPGSTIIEPSDEIRISEVGYDTESKTVTLNWNSRPGAMYAVFYSSDMKVFEELFDSIESEGPEMTFQFPLHDSLANKPRNFFFVSEMP